MAGTEPEPVLRRIERFALAWTLAGLLAYGFGVSWLGGLTLTLAGLASIVNFRGLEAFSLLLEPQRNGNLGVRNTLLIALRLVFLAGVVTAALLLGARHVLALVLGFSVLPAALMTEAGLEACGLLRGDDDGG